MGNYKECILSFKSVSVRKIIALAVTTVFCYLSITEKISSSEFTPIFTMIIGYYFGKSTALDNSLSITERNEMDTVI